jgi:hypothetical protein
MGTCWVSPGKSPDAGLIYPPLKLCAFDRPATDHVRLHKRIRLVGGRVALSGIWPHGGESF